MGIVSSLFAGWPKNRPPIPGGTKRSFSYPQRPDWRWASSSRLLNGNEHELLPWVSCRGVKLAAYLELPYRLRISVFHLNRSLLSPKQDMKVWTLRSDVHEFFVAPTKWRKCIFYVYGSVHRCSILIIVQWDATESSLFIILHVHSTCFGCQPLPSSEVHKSETTASGTGHIFCVQLPPSNVVKPSLATLEGGSCAKNMTSTGGCSFRFVHFWWWEWLTPETCRVNVQNNK